MFIDDLEEVSEYFRVYAWKAGRVLTDADIADVQKVLADYNAEIGDATNAYHQAREQVLREIGGDELVEAAAKSDQWQSAVALSRAFEHFHKKSAEYRDKAKAAPSA
jgi:Ser/Thr protein kinase RdoA (MazF antagonist)